MRTAGPCSLPLKKISVWFRSRRKPADDLSLPTAKGVLLRRFGGTRAIQHRFNLPPVCSSKTRPSTALLPPCPGLKQSSRLSRQLKSKTTLDRLTLRSSSIACTPSSPKPARTSLCFHSQASERHGLYRKHRKPILCSAARIQL